jgi:hypothetical protein
MEADSTAARKWLIEIEWGHDHQAELRENWAFGAEVAGSSPASAIAAIRSGEIHLPGGLFQRRLPRVTLS